MTELPARMLAAQVNPNESNEYKLREVSMPQLEEHDLLVKTEAAGLCHTDLMLLDGQSPLKWTPPITGSHEPVGTVVAKGPKASDRKEFKIGDRVGGINIQGYCYECYECKNIDPKFCRVAFNTGMIGITCDGGFAQYTKMDARSCAVVPPSLSPAQAAPLCCAGITIYVAIKRCGLKPGQVIGISGLGGLGYLGVQMAKAMGLVTVGIDIKKDALDNCAKLPEQLRPDLLVDATKPAQEWIPAITALKKDKVFDGLDSCVSASDSAAAVQYAVALLANHSTLVSAGAPVEGITIPFRDAIFRNISMVGTWIGNPDELQETFDFCAKHNIQSFLIEFGLKEVNEALANARNTTSGKPGKAVVTSFDN